MTRKKLSHKEMFLEGFQLKIASWIMSSLLSFYICTLSLFTTQTQSNQHHHSDLEARIVNGETASANDYPWIVSLQWTDHDNDHHFVACTASLIRSEFPAAILTAAHCCNEGMIPNNDYDITYYGNIGRQYPYSIQPDDNYTELEAFFFWTFTAYSVQETEFTVNALTDYDICVVLLNGDASNIEPITLYNPTDSAMTEQCCSEGQVVRAIGYGLTDHAQTETDAIYDGWIEIDDELRAVDLEYMTSIRNCSDEILECLAEYKDDTIAWADVVPDDGSAICTDSETGAICQGDSGAPLVYFDDDGKVVQVGVGSQSCCVDGVPNMYANVGYFYEGIQSILADETSWVSFVPSSDDDDGEDDGVRVYVHVSFVVIAAIFIMTTM